MNNQVTVNPLWQTLAVAGLRTLLQVGGAAAFISGHPDFPQQLVSGVVVLGSTAWTFIAWYQSHNKTVAAGAAAPSDVKVK